jgi:hypothetical protein
MHCVLFSFEYILVGYVKAELTMMLFEEGPENNIQCRAINGWFKRDSYVSTQENLLSEIEKVKADVVALDMGLYEKIDGIETSRLIRLRFDVPVMYVQVFSPEIKFHKSQTFLKLHLSRVLSFSIFLKNFSSLGA